MTNSNVELAGSGRNIPAKSTGPQTVDGKRRTNAVQHGIFADLVLTGEPFRESLRDYKRLVRALRKDVKVRNALDQVLVEILAFEFLRLSRIYKADAQIAPRMFEGVHKALVEDDPQCFTQSVDKATEIVVIRKALDPELLLRYGTCVTKNIHRILDRFDRK